MPLKGERRSKLSIGARLSMVQDVAAGLADSHGLAEVTAAIRISLEAGVGAAAMVINVMSAEGTNLSTLYDSGTSERTHTLLEKELPLDDGPAKKVISSGEPIYWSTLAQRDREYPGYADFPSACQSWAILPLTVHRVTFGVLSVGWAEPRRLPGRRGRRRWPWPPGCLVDVAVAAPRAWSAIGGGGPADVIHGLAQLTLMDQAHGYATPLRAARASTRPARRRPVTYHHWRSGEARLGGSRLPNTHPSACRHLRPPGALPPGRAVRGHRPVDDGVVERRGADIVEGLEQLSDFVVRHSGDGVQSLADAIASEFCQTPQDDCSASWSFGVPDLAASALPSHRAAGEGRCPTSVF